MKAMKKSGQTIVIIAFTVEIELDCSFEMDKALISPKNRCLFQLGSQAERNMESDSKPKLTNNRFNADIMLILFRRMTVKKSRLKSDL